jgi:hypothetical protein
LVTADGDNKVDGTNDSDFFLKIENMLSDIRSDTQKYLTMNNDSYLGTDTPTTMEQSDGSLVKKNKITETVHFLSTVDLVKELLVSNQSLRRKLESTEENVTLLTSIKRDLMDENGGLHEKVVKYENQLGQQADLIMSNTRTSGFRSGRTNTKISRGKNLNTTFDYGNGGLPRVARGGTPKKIVFMGAKAQLVMGVWTKMGARGIYSARGMGWVKMLIDFTRGRVWPRSLGISRIASMGARRAGLGASGRRTSVIIWG